MLDAGEREGGGGKGEQFVCLSVQQRSGYQCITLQQHTFPSWSLQLNEILGHVSPLYHVISF